MTIRTKLTLNIIFVIAIIAAVATTSVIGMGFVKARLAYLTGKSTPFQMRTVELQRAIQGVSASLVKVSAAASPAEYAAARNSADKELNEVKQAQERLAALAPDTSVKAYEELGAVASDLFAATDSLLKSEKEAVDASKVMSRKMGEMNALLKELDRKIRALQDVSSKLYRTSLGDTRTETAKVRNLEQLRIALKDLQLGYADLMRVTSRKAVIIAQGKINGSLGKATRNEYLKQSPTLNSDIQTLGTKMNELIKAQTAVAGQTAADTGARDALAKEVNEKLSSIALSVEQETIVANDRFNSETTRQGTIFTSSSAATTILVGNSEFVALGHQLEWLATRIFLAEKPADLDAIAAEIKATVGRMDVIRGSLDKALATLNARKEQALLRSAASSLAATRQHLSAEGGVIDKVRQKLAMADRSRIAISKLNTIVQAEAEKSRSTVTSAQGEQEKSIVSVNRVMKFSTTLIIGIGLAAVALGILFGAWIYRSIAKPLQQLIVFSDHVATGDLGAPAVSGQKDEIGRVQGAMTVMIDNLRGIIGRIQDATHTLAGSAEELSATAMNMERGSQEQNSRIEQSAAAVTEMAQTTTEVARNSQETSTAAGKMKAIADKGRDAMHTTVSDLSHFAGMVTDTADKVESLGQKSEKIGAILNLIKDIADQTNLLALNAAIEAARAGEHGHGFAVVADSVRTLAERTTAATNEISGTVRSMLASVAESIDCMKDERQAVERVMGNVSRTLEAIESISTYVEQVTDMVQRIAVAAEEQSSTTEEISRSMEGISAVTGELRASFAHIKTSSDGLAHVAQNLDTQVNWFKL